MYLKRKSIRIVQGGYKTLRTIMNGPYSTLSKSLKISNSEAEYMCLKHPTIAKLGSHEILAVLKVVTELGFNKKILLDHAKLFSFLPITLKYRYRVLEECGIQKILPDYIISYLTLVRQRSIKELKKMAVLPPVLNLENKLASYMTEWPSSLTTLIYGDTDEKTLHQLRLKIIQRHFELVLDLSEDEFVRGVKTYPTIKHRPLAVLKETLILLQSTLMISSNKIRNNLYLTHADPENIVNIIYKLKSIAGIDIKEILRIHPKLVMSNYNNFLEMKKVLQEFGISDEAQERCFEIYTLSSDTVRERLTKAREMPELEALFNHPRFLRIIFYNNTVMNRLKVLYLNNKKCHSLSILTGSSAKYKLFKKAPGDRVGKGKDLVFCLNQVFDKQINSSDIRKKLNRHEFWINVPVVNVKYVYEKLSMDFTTQEIFENCPILLYPWIKIKSTLGDINAWAKKTPSESSDQIDYAKLNKSQLLSLVLYLLEKKHYFTGNGVWTEEQIKNVEQLPNKVK